jgi:hypothetical protein
MFRSHKAVREWSHETETWGINSTRNKPDIIRPWFTSKSNIDSISEHETMGRTPVQSNKLLLVLASTVILDFEPLRSPRPYFCSFQTSTCFEMGPSLRQQEVSDYCWSLPSIGEWLCRPPHSHSLPDLQFLQMLVDRKDLCWSSKTHDHILQTCLCVTLLQVLVSTVLIAYFPLIRHTQLGKRRLQQFYFVAGTCLLATYIYRHINWWETFMK